MVSNSETAPRTIGRPSSRCFLVTDSKARSMNVIEPSTRRTATAIFDGARIMTPSTTAWPPTGRNGMNAPG